MSEGQGVSEGHNRLGSKPEGLVHPLPGPKAPDTILSEAQRPERPAHWTSRSLSQAADIQHVSALRAGASPSRL